MTGKLGCSLDFLTILSTFCSNVQGSPKATTNTGGGNYNYNNYNNNSIPVDFNEEEEDYENEAPLLEELGESQGS